MDFQEVLRAGHREHRLDALLDAAEFQGVPRRRWPGGRDPSGSRCWRCRYSSPPRGRRRPSCRRRSAADDTEPGEVREKRIHQPRLADADDRDISRASDREVHSSTPRPAVARSPPMNPAPVGLLSKPQDLPGQFLPPAVDARLHGPFREAQPLGDLMIRQFLDIAKQNRRSGATRAASAAPASAARRGRGSRAPPAGWPPEMPGDRSSEVTSRSIVCRSLRTLR